MCGRFVATTSPYDLADYFGAILTPRAEEIRPSYNVAPTQPVLTVSESGGERQLLPRRWGLIPSWAKDLSIGSKMINARAETVAEKPSFRSAFRRRRCLIPADGFYEWTTEKNETKKQPWYIFDSRQKPLVFAGLWETWKDAHGTGPDIETCTIITVAANQKMARLHHRQPVFLTEDTWDVWLNPKNDDPLELQSFLNPNTGIEVEYFKVGTEVNNSRSNGASLIAALDEPPTLF